MAGKKKKSDDAFPAHAGMNRQTRLRWMFQIRVPRTRGDEPDLGVVTSLTAKRSPHTRG